MPRNPNMLFSFSIDHFFDLNFYNFSFLELLICTPKMSKKFELSDNEKLLLIECFRARPVLWDPREDDYHKRNIREEELTAVVWEIKMATGRDFTNKQINEAWNILRIQYNACKRKQHSGESGKAAKDVKWKFFEPLSRFIDTIKSTTTYSRPTKIPTTFGSVKKRRRCPSDRDQDVDDVLLAAAKISPLAQMVHEMEESLRKTGMRNYIGFKRRIMAVIDDSEAFLADQEEYDNAN